MSTPTSEIPLDDDFPTSLAAFVARFPDDESCEAVLRRWKYGDTHFRCPTCGGMKSWWLPSKLLDECRSCHRHVSLTAGTVLHGTRKGLRRWFLAIYLFVSSKQGVSALELQRELGLGSYQTAWVWLHKLRRAIGARERTKLSGNVEADETWQGGKGDERPGRPVAGNRKELVAAAIEVDCPESRTWGRVRLAVIPNGSAESLGGFLGQHVERGTTLLTDAWVSYVMPTRELGLTHRPVNVSKSDRQAHDLLPAVHRVFSLLHRVLGTTHQGAVSPKHLQAYLGEFEFRFNRRGSRDRGRLFQRALGVSVRRAPPPYWRIVGRKNAKTPLRASAA